MSGYKLFFVLLLYSGALSGKGPDTLRISNGFLSEQLTQTNAQLLVTSDTTFSISEVITAYKMGEFKPVPEKGLVFSPKPVVYWLTTTIKNESSITKELLLDVGSSQTNKTQLFIFKQGRVDTLRMMGDHFPYNERYFDYRNFAFPIYLAPKQTATLFLYVDRYNENTRLPAYIYSFPGFVKVLTRSDSFIFFYFGAMLFIILAAIVMLVVEPKPIQLCLLGFYVGTFVFLLSNFGIGNQFLWSKYLWINNAIPGMAAAVAFPSMICLVIFYLDTKSKLPVVHKILVITAITGVIIFLSFTAVFILKLVPFKALLNVLSGVAFLIYPVVIISSCVIYYLKYREKRALGFLGAFIFSTASIAISILHRIFEYSFFYNYHIHILLISFLIEFFLLSLIIGRQLYFFKVKNITLLQQLQQNKLTNANNVIKGQTDERKRIAKDLHDSLGIRIAYLQMLVSNILSRHDKVNTLAFTANLSSELKIIAQDIRNISHDLDPIVLEKYGLINAIEDLQMRIKQAYPHLTLDFIYEDKLTHRNWGAEKNTLFFCVQELLTNTLKHAQATKITIELIIHEKKIVLKVQDNGRGLTFEETEETSGIGLQNIKSRVSLLEGNVSMKNIQPNGLLTILSIPIY